MSNVNPKPPNMGGRWPYARQAGFKHVKPILKRMAQENPELLPQACKRLLQDAADGTLSPKDRRMAFAEITDRLDGRALPEQDTEGAPATTVVVLNMASDQMISLPAEQEALLAQITGETAKEPQDFEDDEDDEL